MDIETHEVFLHCCAIHAQEEQEAAAAEARAAQEPEAPQGETGQLFDLAAYGPLSV